MANRDFDGSMVETIMTPKGRRVSRQSGGVKSIDVGGDWMPSGAPVGGLRLYDEMNMSKIPKPPASTAESNSIDAQNELLKKSLDNTLKQQKLGAFNSGVIAITDIVNAYSEYYQTKENAQLNIELSYKNLAETMAIGKENAARAEARGASKGQDALLIAAAQGIDVNSAFAKNLQTQEELYGTLEAMQIESNAIRESYGYEAEAILYRSQKRRAKTALETALVNTGIRTGASLALGLA